jgi:hypothetical protein
MSNAFQWNCFNLVYTCNIALILFLNVMSENLGSLSPLSHNVTLRRPPLPTLTCDVIYGCPLRKGEGRKEWKDGRDFTIGSDLEVAALSHSAVRGLLVVLTRGWAPICAIWHTYINRLTVIGPSLTKGCSPTRFTPAYAWFCLTNDHSGSSDPFFNFVTKRITKEKN